MMLPPVFERYRTAIDTEMRSVLAERQLPMYDMIRYHFGWIDEKNHSLHNSTGKALRPTLCLLAYEATGKDFQKALPASVSLELVHNFSLIHDDIQDNDKERRGRPTVWSIWGMPQAINAGTAARILASITMTRLRKNDFPAEKLLRAQHILDESCLRMIEGQYLDISFERRLDIGLADYMDMIDKKTGALIGCSLEIGALLGTDDKSVISHFRNFGSNLGLAFQIRDDILGIWGNDKKTGKPMGSDIQRRKKSLPIVYALEKAKGKSKTELINIYEGKAVGNQELDTVLGILNDVQAQSLTQSMAEEYCNRALAEIDEMELLPWASQSLKEMAHFLVKREF